MDARDKVLYPEIRDSSVAIARLCRHNNIGDTRYIDGLIVLEAVFAQRDGTNIDLRRARQIERAILSLSADLDHSVDLLVGGRVLAAIYLLESQAVINVLLRDKLVEALHRSEQHYYADLLAQKT